MEAKRYGKRPRRGDDGRDATTTASRARTRSAGREQPVYAHYTSNNTIFGTQWTSEPAPPAGVPLVVRRVERHLLAARSTSRATA